MKLSEVVQRLSLQVVTGENNLEVDVTKGYCSDMLSDVIGNAEEGGLWLTIQKHQNIVAVGVMKALAGIILVKGRQPDENTINKAREENLPIMISPLGSFELAGRLKALGIEGD
ncbi:MAG: DRTGG domain-containing protein [Candidatus Krumholzibacteria bacterium]|nr:DRTGG domain-containing protein [Candidatus Krumholzibacteria bacterium]